MDRPLKFRPRHTGVTAIQYDGHNLEAVLEWLGENARFDDIDGLMVFSGDIKWWQPAWIDDFIHIDANDVLGVTPQNEFFATYEVANIQRIGDRT